MYKYTILVNFDTQIESLAFEVSNLICKYLKNGENVSPFFKLVNCIDTPSKLCFVDSEEKQKADLINTGIMTLEMLLQCPMFGRWSPNEQSPSVFFESEYQEKIVSGVESELQLICLYPLADYNNQLFNKLLSEVSDEVGLNISIQTICFHPSIATLYCSKTDNMNISSELDVSSELEKFGIYKGNLALKNVFYFESVKSDYHSMNFRNDRYQVSVICSDLIRILIENSNSINGLSRGFDGKISLFNLKSLLIDKYKEINSEARALFAQFLSSVSSTIISEEEKQVIEECYDEFKQQLKTLLQDTDSSNYESVLKKLSSIINAENLSFWGKRKLYSLLNNNLLVPNTNREFVTDEIDDILSNFIDDRAGKENNPYHRISEIINEIKAIKERIASDTIVLNKLKSKCSENPHYNGSFSNGGYVFGDKTFSRIKFDDSFIPDNYVPSIPNVYPSVDLRKYFSPIKCQGELGSCCTFSVVSVFEAYINHILNLENYDLSEAFTYYNARALAGDTDSRGGTTVSHVLESLKTDGICEERLCPYNEQKFDEAPSQNAIQDALKRKLTIAQNLEVSVDGFQKALCEGKPIVAVFRVFENLAHNISGLVCLPSDDDIEHDDDESYHAMVIVGYNNAEGYFIVRNSWGQDFGDSGYCYIPYSYIRDKRLTTYACVLSEISVEGDKVGALLTDHSINRLLESPDSDESYLILSNIIQEKEYQIEKMNSSIEKLANEYRAIIDHLIKYDPTFTNIEKNYNEKKNELLKDKSTLENEIKSIGVLTNRKLAISCGILVLLEFVTSLVLYLGYKHYNYAYILLAICGVNILIWIILQLRWIKLTKKTLLKQLDDIKEEIDGLEEKKKQEIEKVIFDSKKLNEVLNLNNLTYNREGISDKIKRKIKELLIKLPLFENYDGKLKRMLPVLSSIFNKSLNDGDVDGMLVSIQKQILSNLNKAYSNGFLNTRSFSAENREFMDDIVQIANSSLVIARNQAIDNGQIDAYFMSPWNWGEYELHGCTIPLRAVTPLFSTNKLNICFLLIKKVYPIDLKPESPRG